MSNEVQYIFRRATDADWPAIWPIFRDVVATGDTYPYSPTTTAEEAHALWMTDPASDRVTYVAEADGEVVGTTYIKPNAVDLMGHIANAGWMIAAHARGQGLGKRFANWTLAEAKDRGFTHMQFNAVVSTNTRAVELWTSLGFEIIGSLPDAFHHTMHGPTTVHIMFRRL